MINVYYHRMKVQYYQWLLINIILLEVSGSKLKSGLPWLLFTIFLTLWLCLSWAYMSPWYWWAIISNILRNFFFQYNALEKFFDSSLYFYFTVGLCPVSRVSQFDIFFYIAFPSFLSIFQYFLPNPCLIRAKTHGAVRFASMNSMMP